MKNEGYLFGNIMWFDLPQYVCTYSHFSPLCYSSGTYYFSLITLGLCLYIDVYYIITIEHYPSSVYVGFTSIGFALFDES
jgi:hypothetical protein